MKRKPRENNNKQKQKTRAINKYKETDEHKCRKANDKLADAIKRLKGGHCKNRL